MDTLTDDIDLAMERRIRDVLREYGRLNKNVDELAADTDLYQSGMTSHASVNVMLGLESDFDVEFPDHMLKRSVFASIGAIREALAQLGAS
jgi:acyl carrier protein